MQIKKLLMCTTITYTSLLYIEKEVYIYYKYMYTIYIIHIQYGECQYLYIYND